MNGILGYDFHPGPKVPKPDHDPSLTWINCTKVRQEWADAIEQAVRDEGAWGLLCTASNCDVALRDVLTPGAVWAATESFSVHLLLARETRQASSTIETNP